MPASARRSNTSTGSAANGPLRSSPRPANSTRKSRCIPQWKITCQPLVADYSEQASRDQIASHCETHSSFSFRSQRRNNRVHVLLGYHKQYFQEKTLPIFNESYRKKSVLSLRKNSLVRQMYPRLNEIDTTLDEPGACKCGL